LLLQPTFFQKKNASLVSPSRQVIVWVLQEGETVSTVNWCRGVQEMGRSFFRKFELGAVSLNHAEVDIPSGND
jgi:hypothetical protein